MDCCGITSCCKGHKWTYILAAPIQPTDFNENIVRTRNNLAWDNKQGCLIAQREHRIGVLLLDSHPLPQLDADVVTDVICQAIQNTD